MTSRYIPPHLRGNNSFIVANPDDDLQPQHSNQNNPNYQSNANNQPSNITPKASIENIEHYEDRKYSKLKFKHENDNIYHQISMSNTEEIESSPLFHIKCANYKQIMSEHLISGYIREIEYILQMQHENICNNIVPISINRICYHFYFYSPIFVFIQSNIDGFSHLFSALDLSFISQSKNNLISNNKINEIIRIKTIMPTGCNSKAESCYIPNIFYHSPLMKKALLKQNKNIDNDIMYDAILTNGTLNSKKPHFLIFNAKKLYNTDICSQKQAVVHKFALKFEIDGRSKMVFCGENGIMYNHHSYLCQLKLNDISNMSTSPIVALYDENTSSYYVETMHYLKALKSLLIIYSFWRLHPYQTQTVCKIYNFTTKQLITLPEYNWTYSGNRSVCCNAMNSNQIYFVSSCGEVILYDITQKIWTVLCDGANRLIFDGNKPIILSYGYQPDVIYAILYIKDESALKCAYFDTRNNNAKWQICPDSLDINWEFERLSLFL